MAGLWEKGALLAAVTGEARGSLPASFGGVSIDSRTLIAGDIFFCIKGERFNGHDFAAAAYKAGAGCLVVDKAHAPVLQQIGAPLLVVDNVLTALEQLGKSARARMRGTIIAVTGSVGKTTTKEALRHILKAFGRVHANPSSFNNHWGVPLSLARMPADCDFGVFELGMNHAGEIRTLVSMVKPHIALITKIATGHMGFFQGIEDIAAAKAEIFTNMGPDPAAVLPADDHFFDSLSQTAKAQKVKTILSFGKAKEASCRLLRARLLNDHSEVDTEIGGRKQHFTLKAPGAHMVDNSLATLAICYRLGLDLEKASALFADFYPQKGRGARYTLALSPEAEFTLIDESYNANPASMRAALALLSIYQGRRLAVLGDMLELGKDSVAYHNDLVSSILASKIDHAFLIGPQMAGLTYALSKHIKVDHRLSTDDIVEPLIKNLRGGDVVMVKSSSAMGSSALVTALLERYKPKNVI